MENVTAITKLSTCRGLSGLSSSIKYAANPKPHNSDNGKIKHRNFVISGWNCSNNPKLAYEELVATLNKNYITPVNISGIRCIISFKGLNYHKAKDRQKAYNLDSQFIKKKYPNAQVLMFGQFDNKHHIIHFHNIICSKTYTTGNNVDSSWYTTAPVMDTVLKNNGYQPLNKGKLKRSAINRSLGKLFHFYNDKSYIMYLSEKIVDASHKATTDTEFAKLLKNQGITVERFKMTKVQSGRKIKEYSHPTKEGHYKLLTLGNYARYRKHWSYSFKWHNKKIVIREKKLGSNFATNKIIHMLHRNAIKDNYQAQSNKLQYMPIFKTPNKPKRKHYNNNHHQALSNKLKHWNYREYLHQRKLKKIMKQYNNDSDSDIFSDTIRPTGPTW